MGRFPKLVALAAVVALTLAACGGDDVPGPGGNGDTPDLAGQSVEVAAVWVSPEADRFRLVLDAFEAKTGAEATFTSTGDDIAAVIRPRIDQGNAPDIAILPQPALLAAFASEGVLKEIDFVRDELDANYAEDAQALGIVDDRLYGIWFKAASKSTVWYNVNVFNDAGVEPPEDWDGFLEISQTIADFGIPPQSIGGGDGWVLTDWFENVYLQTAGSEKYDQLVAHEIEWTDESVTTALETLAELWGKKNLISGDPLQIDFNGSVPRVFRADPQAAIVFEGDFVAGVITGETEAELGVDADFFPFPTIADSPSVVGGGDMAVMMNDTPAARALLEFLATPEAQEIWVKEGGFLSPLRTVSLDVYPDEITRRVAEGLQGAEQVRFDMSDLVPPELGSTTGAGMWKLFQDFLKDPSDPASIQRQLEAVADRAYG